MCLGSPGAQAVVEDLGAAAIGAIDRILQVLEHLNEQRFRQVNRREGVPATKRAAVEAALEAAGILDAWLTPDGHLLHPQTLDVMLRAGEGSAGRNLTEVLVPIPHAGVSEGVIVRALAAVPLVDRPEKAQGQQTWIATTGQWRLGPLVGRWRKESAEHVGAAARQAARLRKLAAIDEDLAALDASLGRVDSSLGVLETRRDLLDGAERVFPGVEEIRRATIELRAAGQRFERADLALQAAERRVVDAANRRDRAAGKLEMAAVESGLREALGDLHGLALAVDSFRRILAGAVGTCRVCLSIEAELFSARHRGDRALKRNERSRSVAEEAARRAEASRVKARAFEQTAGKDIKEVLARRNSVATALRQQEVLLENQQNDLITAAQTLGRPWPDWRTPNMCEGRRSVNGPRPWKKCSTCWPGSC